MNFLKNILKPFVEFKEEETPAQQQPPANAPAVSQPAEKIPSPVSLPDNTYVSTPPPASISTGTTTGSSSSIDYRKHFDELIQEANQKNPVFQGTDFKEFIDSKADVEAITDEETRYKTAFNVLKRTGLTKEKLVSTGQQYIQLIEADLKGFVAAFDQEYKKNVELKEELLQKKAAELKSLNDRTVALQTEVKTMSEDIQDSKIKLSSNKNAFFEAGEKIKNEIHAELQKIDRYF